MFAELFLNRNDYETLKCVSEQHEEGEANFEHGNCCTRVLYENQGSQARWGPEWPDKASYRLRSTKWDKIAFWNIKK